MTWNAFGFFFSFSFSSFFPIQKEDTIMIDGLYNKRQSSGKHFRISRWRVSNLKFHYFTPWSEGISIKLFLNRWNIYGFNSEWPANLIHLEKTFYLLQLWTCVGFIFKAYDILAVVSIKKIRCGYCLQSHV